MELVSYSLVAVAFVRSVGGRVRLLLAVERAGSPLFDGEPVLLAELRPGDVGSLVVEVADVVPASAVDAVVRDAREALVDLVDTAFAADGTFDGSCMLGRPLALVGAPGTFGEAGDAGADV